MFYFFAQVTFAALSLPGLDTCDNMMTVGWNHENFIIATLDCEFGL